MKSFVSTLLAIVVGGALLLLGYVAYQRHHVQSVDLPSQPVLQKIDTYKAPPYPRDDYPQADAYDYRVEQGLPVPSSFTDTLICDIAQIIKKRFGGVLSEENISRAINMYQEENWTQIPGYRTWTHWNFIRALTVSERQRLVKEVAAFIKDNGVRDPAP